VDVEKECIKNCREGSKRRPIQCTIERLKVLKIRLINGIIHIILYRIIHEKRTKRLSSVFLLISISALVSCSRQIAEDNQNVNKENAVSEVSAVSAVSAVNT